jgi:hypothetical protein
MNQLGEQVLLIDESSSNLEQDDDKASLHCKFTGPSHQGSRRQEYQVESSGAPALHATVAVCYQGGSSS